MKPNESRRIDFARRFRTARRNLVFLAAQSREPGPQAALLQADEEIQARREALIASEGRSDP